MGNGTVEPAYRPESLKPLGQGAPHGLAPSAGPAVSSPPPSSEPPKSQPRGVGRGSVSVCK